MCVQASQSFQLFEKGHEYTFNQNKLYQTPFLNTKITFNKKHAFDLD